jgi:hypothetical protein
MDLLSASVVLVTACVAREFPLLNAYGKANGGSVPRTTAEKDAKWNLVSAKTPKANLHRTEPVRERLDTPVQDQLMARVVLSTISVEVGPTTAPRSVCLGLATARTRQRQRLLLHLRQTTIPPTRLLKLML